MSTQPDTPRYAELLGVAAYAAVYMVGLHCVDHRLDMLGTLGLIWLSMRALAAVEWLGRFEARTRPAKPTPAPPAEQPRP